MVVPNCLDERCDSAHLVDRKCIYHLTPLAQRTVGDLVIYWVQSLIATWLFMCCIVLLVFLVFLEWFNFYSFTCFCLMPQMCSLAMLECFGGILAHWTTKPVTSYITLHWIMRAMIYCHQNLTNNLFFCICIQKDWTQVMSDWRTFDTTWCQDILVDREVTESRYPAVTL